MDNEDGIITYAYNKEGEHGWKFMVRSEIVNFTLQWRIRDFPEGAPTAKGVGADILFDQFFPTTAWKERNIGTGDLPLHSDGMFYSKWFISIIGNKQ